MSDKVNAWKEASNQFEAARKNFRKAEEALVEELEAETESLIYLLISKVTSVRRVLLAPASIVAMMINVPSVERRILLQKKKRKTKTITTKTNN